jgi:hypothetical protein
VKELERPRQRALLGSMVERALRSWTEGAECDGERQERVREAWRSSVWRLEGRDARHHGGARPHAWLPRTSTRRPFVHFLEHVAGVGEGKVDVDLGRI